MPTTSSISFLTAAILLTLGVMGRGLQHGIHMYLGAPFLANIQAAAFSIHQMGVRPGRITGEQPHCGMRSGHGYDAPLRHWRCRQATALLPTQGQRWPRPGATSLASLIATVHLTTTRRPQARSPASTNPSGVAAAAPPRARAREAWWPRRGSARGWANRGRCCISSRQSRLQTRIYRLPPLLSLDWWSV
jgi:hypothetical protein